ncbi:DNA adenine methylase [Tenacibaculum sp. 190524A02b]|uniref:DNA adenine methylase n=1 Tax=Tenacibaculum vairaonense TaxID=3137860 RepID=UPI0031FAFBCC
MVLTRLGNKRKMKDLLNQHFPVHKMRIELFFGAGGSFFYLPKPKFSILNDFDSDVSNLYLVILDQKEELKKQIELLPVSEGLLDYWKKNTESDPVMKAVRFLLISNFTYLGKGDTLRLGKDNTKRNLLKRIELTFEMLSNSKITNCDFRQVLQKVSFDQKVTPKNDCFVYLDPVYLETDHYYKVPKWTAADTEDCFKIMNDCGIKCAMSEFDHESVMDFASDYKMNVIYLKERQNIKNKRNEILITNYDSNQLSMF